MVRSESYDGWDCSFKAVRIICGYAWERGVSGGDTCIPGKRRSYHFVRLYCRFKRHLYTKYIMACSQKLKMGISSNTCIIVKLQVRSHPNISVYNVSSSQFASSRRPHALPPLKPSILISHIVIIPTIIQRCVSLPSLPHVLNRRSIQIPTPKARMEMLLF